MKYYCFPSRCIWHFVLRGLQATHRPRLAGLLLPSCLIVVLLLGCVWNSGPAPVDVSPVYSSNAVFENTVYTVTSSRYYRVICTEVVVYINIVI